MNFRCWRRWSSSEQVAKSGCLSDDQSAENGHELLATSIMGWAEVSEEIGTAPPTSQEPDEGSQDGAQRESESSAGVATVPGAKAKPRPGRYGLSIRFESLERDPDLGRLVESTVVINDTHPAYRRAAASRSEGYHIALAVALALARLAVPPAEEHEFVTAFLTHWGEALDRTPLRSRKRR